MCRIMNLGGGSSLWQPLVNVCNLLSSALLAVVYMCGEPCMERLISSPAGAFR